MSIARTHVFLAVAAALLTLASHASAQREIHHVPPAVTFDGYNPDLLHPFIEPLTFDHDWQFFQQADPEIFGDPVENIGWFATYSRMYLWVTRPDNQDALSQNGQPYIAADGTNGDFSWGNRFDVGYMTGEDHGWFMTFFNLKGPNVFDVLQVERHDVLDLIDQVNAPALPGTVAPDDLRGGGTRAVRTNIPGYPTRDRNNPFTLQRDYLVTNSVNHADLSSWELNKTFRFDRLHYGSRLEPFIGFRYSKFTDFYRRDTYIRRDTNGTIVAIGAPTTPPAPQVGQSLALYEDLISNKAEFVNYLVGGQFGFRSMHEKGRWHLSSELRTFVFQNFQSFERTSDLESTHYTGNPAVDVPPLTVRYNREKFAGHATEFVFGGDIRADAAYHVTRDVALNLGMQFMYFGKGIGRGGDLQQNDQDVILIGATMGFIVNR